MLKYILLASLITMMLVSTQTATAYEVDMKGKVTSVLDGDTLKITTSSGSTTKIRLIIVDAPELGTRSTADDAKTYVKDHCLNKNATADINDPAKKDSSGRTLAIVHCGTDMKPINQLLLELDYAVNYRHFTCTQPNEFKFLEWVYCP